MPAADKDGSYRVGILGADVSQRLEPLAHQYLSSGRPALVCERIRIDADRYDLVEDFMEMLAKGGMFGIHVVWPYKPYASARAEWLPSAEGAGCVDTVVFRDGGDSVPLGANVTADAFIDLFAQFGIEPNGTTLVHGAGHSARSLITALESLEASRILVYDPRRRNLAAIAENVQATGVRKGLVEVVDDPAAALKVADGFADCLHPEAGPRLEVPSGPLQWWFDGPGRELGAHQQAARLLLPGWCLSVHRAARARWLWLHEVPEHGDVGRALARMSDALGQAGSCT